MRVFGSVARGEASPTSDIDLLVKMDRGRSLLDLIELSQELESVLHCKVDILIDEGLSPYLEQRIQAEPSPYEGRPYLSAAYSGCHPTHS